MKNICVIVIPDRLKKRENLMLLIPLILIIIGILASLLVPKISRQVDIDRCLDAGGKYDYANDRCVGIRSILNE